MADAGACILIVDDYVDVLEMYEEYLRFHGFDVATARDGQEAIQVAMRRRPSLIFMDLRMPDVSGEDALRILRADPAFCDVPIVALTAHALQTERAAALRAGFDDVISKPCMPEELLAYTRRFLADGRPSG